MTSISGPRSRPRGIAWTHSFTREIADRVCVCVCACVCVRVTIHTYTVCVSMYACIEYACLEYACMAIEYACMHAMHACIRKYIYTGVRVCAHTHKHTHTKASTHTHTHKHTHLFPGSSGILGLGFLASPIVASSAVTIHISNTVATY
jgi:hypothetical protein